VRQRDPPRLAFLRRVRRARVQRAAALTATAELFQPRAEIARRAPRAANLARARGSIRSEVPMAGVSVDGGKGRRRSLDSEVNMIPMIDLLMVTVAFLLITAVWSTMARVDANAKVPGQDNGPPCDGACEHPKELHVDLRYADKIVLTWRQDSVVLASFDVPRKGIAIAGGGMRFADLGAAVEAQWKAQGTVRAPTDLGRDRAVLHTSNDTRYEEMIAAMDAIYGVKRAVRGGTEPAFAVTLATN
jgi:biopolymer transport protein ExbD